MPVDSTHPDYDAALPAWERARDVLADIIALNLDHYRLDADFKHGLHCTALPTAWVAGFDGKNELNIGSRTAWRLNSNGEETPHF